jgi:hypothetical protein
MITFHDIFHAIIGHVTRKREKDVATAILRLIDADHPVIQFVRMCIAANTRKTRCYFDARKAGTAVRKQVQLALYDYLKSKEAPPVVSVYCYRDNLGTHGSNYVGVTLYFIEEAEQDFFEEVREYIADELETYTGLEYERSPLSTCDAEDIRIVSDVEDTDFVFEVGDLKSGKFKYWGYWHEKKWNRLQIFEDFDIIGLTRLLRGR